VQNTSKAKKLLIIGTHPIQYLAPVYRMLEEKWNVPVQLVYASDFSEAGYFDKAFRAHFAWDVDLFTQPHRCTFLSRVKDGGATCFDEISAKGLGKALEEASPAAVMLTGYSPSFHLHAFWQAFRHGYPILLRAETINRPPTRGPRWMRDLMLRNLYARCKRLLPIGKRSYEHYREFGCPDEKLVLSPYCVDTTPFQCDDEARARLRPATRTALGIPDDKTVILFSGKLGQHKRPHLLIEAVKRLPKIERDRIALIFLGSGPDQDTLAAEAAKDPAIPAVFPGFKNQTELSPYYHAADLLALPSEFETWGLVVNEALHHGIPCLVTDTVGSAADLVYPGITGEIASKAVESVTAALIRAVRLARREDVRANCRLLIANYTVESASKGICEAFRQVVDPVFG
jgi:glycosyltransferase involved in cell wall biosynthesis